MDDDEQWSDREYLRRPRLGPVLIAAYGLVLHGRDGVYFGYPALVRELCGGQALPRRRGGVDEQLRLQLMAQALKGIELPTGQVQQVMEAASRPGVEAWLKTLRSAGILSLLVLGREEVDEF